MAAMPGTVIVAALLSAIHVLTLALGTALPSIPLDRYRRINAIEVVLVVLIVCTAAFMARGAWLF